MDDVESKAELVYRYMRARRRLRGATYEAADVDRMKREIRDGRDLVVLGICIDPTGVIAADEHDHKFFQAIFEGREDAIHLELDCLQQWRKHVLKNGRYPSCPEARPVR